MWFFYLISLIPALIGGILLYKSAEIIWQEWLGATIAGLLTAAIFQCIAYFSMTADVETWSGELIRVEHHPAWTEQYTEYHSETYTDSQGNTQTRTWTTTEYEHHPEHWLGVGDLGQKEKIKHIESELFDSIAANFGGKLFTYGTQSSAHGGHCINGDNNIYAVNNDTDYKYPITAQYRFTNKIKAAPSLFSYSKIENPTNLFEYPQNDDWMRSDRLLGSASTLIDINEFDKMNSRLGPIKKVNVIMVGFLRQSPDIAQLQESYWIGGKKNDLVICFGGGNRNKNPDWIYVFGWTEKDIVKHNLRSALLSNPVNESVIPIIEKEIRRNYEIKDWSKFDMITVEPPTWAYITYFVILIGTQVGLYIWFHSNDLSKDRFRRLTNFNRWRRITL